MPAILKFGNNMESQKRPRSEDNDDDASVSKKFPRIATPIRSETKEAVKLLLSERKKKAERVEMQKFDEIQVLEELKNRIAKIDENLHCEVEIVSGHPSSAVLCVFPSREKSFNDTIGSFQPVRYLFTPSGHYKFQVFIHRTIAEGKIDIESFAELSALLDKIRKTSGYQMCPGIKDFDEILEDVRMRPATVKEELWPWRHVGAKSCKLWHKPRNCFVQRDEAERELEGVCSNCKQVRRELKIVQTKRKDLADSAKARRQEASSKVKICHLSPASQQAREFNVRRERKNYRREAERLRTSTALTVSEEQSKELAMLIECISSSEEGQKAVKAVCNEADEQQPGSGAILKELWELEREAFFKDQRTNETGKRGNRWSPATIRVGFCLMCQTCHSTKSWNDCLKNTRTVKCRIYDSSSESVCMTVFVSKLYNTSQQVDEFAKSCWIKSMCSNEYCRYDSIKEQERGIIKATYCNVDCCVGDLCNSGSYNAGTPSTMFSNFYLIIFALVISMFK